MSLPHAEWLDQDPGEEHSSDVASDKAPTNHDQIQSGSIEGQTVLRRHKAGAAEVFDRAGGGGLCALLALLPQTVTPLRRAAGLHPGALGSLLIRRSGVPIRPMWGGAQSWGSQPAPPSCL